MYLQRIDRFSTFELSEYNLLLYLIVSLLSFVMKKLTFWIILIGANQFDQFDKNLTLSVTISMTRFSGVVSVMGLKGSVGLTDCRSDEA